VKNKTFEHYIASLSKDDDTIWKATKRLKKPQISITPIRKGDRSWAKRDCEKATTFAEHLEQVFTSFANINPNDSEIEKNPGSTMSNVTYQTILTQRSTTRNQEHKSLQSTRL
jgi:hypothetical protein